MPGNAGTPYWAVEHDSEERDSPPSHNRIYMDPWDNEAYEMTPAETAESSHGDNFNSFAGEPVSASFYYVPTKNYDSGEEPPMPPPPPRRNRTPEQMIPPDYPVYGRKFSRNVVPVPDPEVPMYCDMPMNRRRSMYLEEPVYIPHPMAYEHLYGPMIPPPPGYMPPRPRTRMSLPPQPDYIMPGQGYNHHRRQSRMTDVYEQLRGTYESVSPDYEDWARPYPKAAPENFHLSRYGHLQIDYSCSWNSLDRLIRNQ